MIKYRYLVVFFLLGLSIFGLFQIKFKVQTLHRELAEIKHQLDYEKNSMHVLKAEWAYLNKPERLQRLSTKFLDVSEIKPDQILLASNSGITNISNVKRSYFNRSQGKIIRTSYTPPSNTVKWRFRERPDLTRKK